MIGQTMHECNRPCTRSHSFGVTRRCIRARLSCAVKCDRCVATCANEFELAIALFAFALLDVGARDANVSRGGATCDASSDASRCLIEPVFGA